MIKTVKLEVDGLTLSAIQTAINMGILQLQNAMTTVQTQTQEQITADLLASQAGKPDPAPAVETTPPAVAATTDEKLP